MILPNGSAAGPAAVAAMRDGPAGVDDRVPGS
jgi:hypothetical protein